MKTYRFHASPQLIYTYPGYAVRTLSYSGILQALSGAVVNQLVGTPTSGYDVEIQLERPTHAEAMHDIRTGLEDIGFTVVQAEITEWLTATAELTFLGGASGGALGAATKDPALAFLLALIGAGAGALAAHLTKKVKARFDAQLVHPHGPAGWSITPQTPPDTQPYPAPWPYPSY